MGEFFGSMYCVFEELFGLELAEYLWGNSSPVSINNQFIAIGFWMLGIALSIAIVYYYVVNHPRLCNWWGWSIFAVLTLVINFIVGWQWVLKDLYEGKMIKIDPVTNQEVPLDIFETDCIYFGFSNMILSFVAFFIISCIIKWWSSNCASAPFVK